MNFLLILTFFLTPLKIFGQKIDSIYGKDQRQNYFELSQELKDLSQSQVVLALKEDLTPIGKNKFKINAKNLGEAENLCPEEKFLAEPTLGSCSGVIWSENYVITAGHCIDSKTCKDMFIIQNYYLKSKSDILEIISGEKIYRCQEVVTRSNTNSLDYAIIKLDRSVLDFKELKQFNSSLNKGIRVYSLGFPSGLPLKFSGYGEIQSLDRHFFSANITGFEGSSGSAVFSEETNEIVGIYTSGEKDYIWDRKRKCKKAFVCTSELCSGEEITYFQLIHEKLRELE